MDSVDEILNHLEDKLFVVGIFFDLAKAFDTLNHSLLLDKLYCYGIRGQMWNWFQSYLTGRTQYVSINGVSSSPLSIDFGVPQGSVLGPLLFLIFINDIGRIPGLGGKPKLFADDTNLFISSHSLSDLEIKSQLSINAIANWILSNRLTLNIDKTCYVLVSPSRRCHITSTTNLNLHIHNYPINRVTSIKYFGVYLDEDLNCPYILVIFVSICVDLLAFFID